MTHLPKNVPYEAYCGGKYAARPGLNRRSWDVVRVVRYVIRRVIRRVILVRAHIVEDAGRVNSCREI